MIYTKLLKFKYNNKNYQLLMDNRGKYFFLEITEKNNYRYVTKEDYINLAAIFTSFPSIMNAEGKKIKLIPKIIIGGTAVVLSLSTLTGCMPGILGTNGYDNEYFKNFHPDSYYEELAYNSSDTNDNFEEQSNAAKFDIETSLSFDVEDSDEQFVYDTYYKSETFKTINIYDMSYLDKIFSYKSVSKEQLLNAVRNNSKISNSFKEYLYEYINLVTAKYPNIDYRVLYENLKTLKIKEVSKAELTAKTMNFDSYACYSNNENIIYTQKDFEYKKGTWEYQVLFHEISHALRTKWFDTKEYAVRIQSWGPSCNLSLINEALNSVFAVSIYDDTLFTEKEKDVAYQLQSNYMLVLIDSLGNYSIEDYVQHSIGYLAKKMDEAHGDNNYGVTILTLMDAQYKDYHSNSIEISQDQYYPLYDYMCDVYFKKHLNTNMSYDEAKKVCDKLISIITFDVPKEYNIDINHFYDYFDTYCMNLGIQNGKVR